VGLLEELGGFEERSEGMDGEGRRRRDVELPFDFFESQQVSFSLDWMHLRGLARSGKGRKLELTM
jgi:hypothetical protein